MACVCFGVLLWDDPNKPIGGGPAQQNMPGTDSQQPITQGHHTSYAGAAKGGNAYTHDEKRQHEEKHVPISAAGGVEDVLFFPDGQMPCKWWATAKGCNRQNCQFAHARTSLARFLEYLNRAQSTLDICVFTITCNEIADSITEAHKRGVKVRILSDNAQTQTTGSDVDELQNSGIAVKHAVQQGNNLMHHKFAVIDNKLLLTGSFNWTRQAVLGNQENVLVTSNTTYVNKFHAQFEKLWATGGI